jgi:hypothetical protein
MLVPRVVFFYMGAMKLALHMEYPPRLKLNRKIKLRVKLILNLPVFIFQMNSKNKLLMTRVVQPPSR